MYTTKFKFSRLPTTDEDADHQLESKFSQPGKGTSTWGAFPRVGAILLTITLSAIVALAIFRTSIFHVQSKWTSCGNDPSTARSRGCSFDLLSFAWQTPECYDAELLSEFANWDGEWTFYADDKYTQPVSQAIALRGERTPLFVKMDYHLVHCTFMWRQMHRAYENGFIDAHLGNYNHTLHCQKMLLMDPVQGAKKVVMARIIYPECKRVKH